MVGLRERRHQETREHLVDTAFALFATRGFETVTVEEIAQAAGASRSTVYRRFPTKEDLVLEIPRRWLTEFDAAAAALPPDTTLPDAVHATSMAVARHIDDNRDIVLAAYRVLEDAPNIRSARIGSTAWLNRLSALVERFSDVDVDAETASVLAGAYFGGIEAMMQHWSSTGGSHSVADSTERLLVRLRPILA